MSFGRGLGACLALVVGGVPATAQSRARLQFAASASLVEHRVDVGTGVARTVGPVGGAHVTLGVAPWLELRADGRSGHLAAKTPSAEARDVAELGLGASVPVGSSLAFTAGYERRVFTGTIGSQRWTALRVGAEERVTFIGGAIRGVFQAALLPIVSVSGLRSPDLAVAVGSGLEVRGGRVVGSVLYTLERYDFPREGPDRRLEQLAALTVQVGVRLGRGR